MEQNIEVKENKRPFGKRDLIGYFFGDFGCNMSFTLQASYLFIFYTQFIGISLEHWAMIILITKIFDGINDPIAGFLIDKIGAKTKGNKFKPWIKYGGPILAAVPMLMFIDSSGWSYAAKLIICFVTYLAWDLAYTIVNVPYGALSSVMTTDAVERTQLSTVRSWGGMLGGIGLGMIIPMFVYSNTTIDGNTVSLFIGENMFIIAAALGVVALLSFMILYFNVEERVVVEPELDENGEIKEVGVVQTIKDLAKNRPFWGLMFAAVGQLLFLMGANQLYQLTLQMYYNDGSLTSYLTLMRLAPLILGAIIGTALVKRFGKKEVASYPLLIAVVILAIAYFIPIPNPYVYLGVIFISTTLGFGQMLYTWAMMSDVIDYQEYITGNRNEGSVYALYSMGRKIMQGLSSSIVPFAMTIVAPALVANDPTTWTQQNSAAINDLSFIFAIVGNLIVFIGLNYIYNLDNETIEEMNVELDKRRNQAGEPVLDAKDDELEGALKTPETI
jgi:GPH family glycoside/pentoside/hexuronide:cation symporter